jgi:hypothetical protein
MLPGGSSIYTRRCYRHIVSGLFIMAALAIVATASTAQSTDYRTGPAPGIQWSKTYDMPGYGWAESVYPTSDGGYVITGMTYGGGLDVFLIKTSANGDRQWGNTFGGSQDDDGLSVIQASDGGYVLAGIKGTPTNYADIYLVKTDGNGKEQWSRTYGTSGPDWGYAVIATDGGYLLAGAMSASNNNGYSGSDGYLVKVSPQGDQLWARQYIEPGMYGERFYALRETADGNYIIAGTVGKLDDKICLVKVDRGGNQLWIKSYDTNGSTHNVRDVRQTADGGYILAGGGKSPYGTQYLLRTDSDGKMSWYKEYDTFGKQFGGTVEQLPDGGFIAGGACLVRTDKDGNLLWAEITNVSFSSYQTAVVSNRDGSYTVTGGVQTGVNMIQPIMVRTMAAEEASATTRPASFVLPALDAGWLTTTGMALGLFVLLAGAIIILLIIVLIVDERINRPRK